MLILGERLYSMYPELCISSLGAFVYVHWYSFLDKDFGGGGGFNDLNGGTQLPQPQYLELSNRNAEGLYYPTH
jgi:hypothetical protein